MIKGDRAMTKEEVNKMIQEYIESQKKSKKIKRDYKQEILDHLKDGLMDGSELRILMKCSNSDYYRCIDQLIKEEKIVKVPVGKKISFTLKETNNEQLLR